MSLTKSEIARAVEAIRSLSDVIEKLHKASWPDAVDSDILRKSDLAEPMGDAAKRALDKLRDAEKRIERLEAAKDLDSQHAPRPRYEVER